MTFSSGPLCGWHRRWAEYPNYLPWLDAGVNPLPWLAGAALDVPVSCSGEGSMAVVALGPPGVRGRVPQQEEPCLPTCEPAILRKYQDNFHKFGLWEDKGTTLTNDRGGKILG